MSAGPSPHHLDIRRMFPGGSGSTYNDPIMERRRAAAEREARITEEARQMRASNRWGLVWLTLLLVSAVALIASWWPL